MIKTENFSRRKTSESIILTIQDQALPLPALLSNNFG